MDNRQNKPVSQIGLEKLMLLDSLEPRHEDSATATFPALATTVTNVKPIRPLRVCIVTEDIIGPVRHGGIGTAYRYVADLLVSAGHDVTILYALGTHAETGTIEEWIEYYANRGIKLVPVPRPDIAESKGPLGKAMKVPYFVYWWLKDQQFDLVHMSEWRGTGYYCLLAKQQGLAFQDTLFCVKCSSPTLWSRLGGYQVLDDRAQLIRCFIERRCVEVADIVVSGSLHMLRWMLEQGYNLPRARCYVQPNVMLKSTYSTDHTGAKNDFSMAAIDEIVFFGRLELRKGIHLFCEAIDRLEKKGIRPKKVTFLGKRAKVFDFWSFIARYQGKWPFEVQFLTDHAQPDAIAYLCGSGRLAIIPSLLENSSFAIYECLVYRIAFLASDRGGNPELIAPEDRDGSLFEAHPEALANKIASALRNGALRPKPSFDDAENNRIWLDWHAQLTVPGKIEAMGAHPRFDATQILSDRPLVTVCLAHYERPDLVMQAIDSIRRQTYQNIEVILVDDGSTSEAAVARLNELETDFREHGWQIVRQENRYLGASRNAAARRASGEFLLFMDDDNVAKPEAVQTFLRTMQATGADILTCFADVFVGQKYPAEKNCVSRVTPIGPNVTFNMFRNGFGDSNCFVRRSAFNRIDGFTEDYKVGKDDMEFFAKATLSGLKLEVLPLPLYYYRRPDGSGMKSQNVSDSAGQLRALRPFVDALPLAFRNTILYSVGLDNAFLECREKLGTCEVTLRSLRKQFPYRMFHQNRAYLNRLRYRSLIFDIREELIVGFVYDKWRPKLKLTVVAFLNQKFYRAVTADKKIKAVPGKRPSANQHVFHMPVSNYIRTPGNTLELCVIESSTMITRLEFNEISCIFVQTH